MSAAVADSDVFDFTIPAVHDSDPHDPFPVIGQGFGRVRDAPLHVFADTRLHSVADDWTQDNNLAGSPIERKYEKLLVDAFGQAPAYVSYKFAEAFTPDTRMLMSEDAFLQFVTQISGGDSAATQE